MLRRSSSMFRVGRVASDLLRRLSLPPSLARRDATPTVMTSDRLSHQDRLSRLLFKSWIPCRLISIAHATTRCLDNQNVTTEVDKELIDCKPTMDRVYFAPVIKNSSHRDGVIYKNKFIWQDFWEGDIADRNETQLEPMMFSKATEECLPVAENCVYHFQQHMFQFFSVQLSKTPFSTGPIQLYGYIAARDLRDGMLNYVVNYSRDDPVVVQQGSLIEMTGPK